MTGKCEKADGRCQCVDNNRSLRVLCQHWRIHEEQAGELEQRSISNWNMIAQEDRVRCLAQLKRIVHAETQARWRSQAGRGMRIGSDDVRFHFGVGMVVRNALRFTLPDDKLPPVGYPDGPSRNWDDHYYGALDALVRLVAA